MPSESFSDQVMEIAAAQQRVREETALSDFERLVDNLGVETVINRMNGDTFWKLYTYFKNTMGDGG